MPPTLKSALRNATEDAHDHEREAALILAELEGDSAALHSPADDEVYELSAGTLRALVAMAREERV